MATSLIWRSNFFNATWFSGRPVLTGPVPPGTNRDTDQLRFAAGADLFGPFRIDTEVNWDVRRE